MKTSWIPVLPIFLLHILPLTIHSFAESPPTPRHTVSFSSHDFLGYWKLDGDFTDVFGTHHGSYVEEAGGPAAFVPGSDGEALDLTDGSGYVDLGLKVGSDPKTISVFVRTDEYQPELVWVGNAAPERHGDFDHRFYIGTFHGKAFWGGGHIYRNEVEWPSTTAGTFHHYALVLKETDANGGVYQIFQDGILVQEASFFGTTRSDPQRPMQIGRGGGQMTHPAMAVIDDVALFNRALSQTEIQAITKAGCHAPMIRFGNSDRTVPQLPQTDEKIRMIIDTDAANEIDDLYALALALASPEKFEIEGIVAAHYGDAGGPDGINKSYDLILELLEVAGMQGKIPVYKGSPPFQYSKRTEHSEGVDFITSRAMDTSDPRPLWVVSLGACTNVAMAWIQEPQIANRVISLWHARTQWPERCWNFNAYNDLKAVRVMMQSDLPLVFFDTGAYLRAPMTYTEKHIAAHGALGAYLHQFRYRREWFQSPDKGFFDLGDIAILTNPALCEWEIVDVPRVDWDMRFIHSKQHGKMLRVYQIQNQSVFDLLRKQLHALADQSQK